MRFLIVSIAIFVCTVKASSGGLVAAPYAPVAVATVDPTVPPEDIQGAIIDAQVQANNNARLVADNVQQINDQEAELQGRAINIAKGHIETALSDAQNAQAQMEGAAAAVAPAAARTLVAPVTYVAPALTAPVYATRGLLSPAYAAATIPATYPFNKFEHGLNYVHV